MKPKQQYFRAIAIGLGALTVAASAAFAGCVEAPSGLAPPPTGGGGTEDGGAGDGGPVIISGRDLFESMEADLMSACGLCHDVAGLADTPFLAGPDRYQSFASWPGVVATDPEHSLLLSYAMTGKGHSGTNLDSPALKNTLLPKVKAWLAQEAMNFTQPPPQAGPHIDPFVPIMGFNAIYLGALGPEFEGMAVTFQADLLAETTLELTNIELHPTSKTGVKIVHPLWVVHPLGKDPNPDPVDSFSNVDTIYQAGESGALGPGTLVLVNYSKDAKLSLAFELIQKYEPASPDAGDGGPTGGCKDVASFDANAKQQFGACLNCHGGGNGQAVAAVDMSGLNNDSAKACGQIRNRVNPNDPASSQIFITTNPGGNAAHPFKFGGQSGAFNNFRDSVSIWIAAEK
ncbi:hypothetical protein [Polyangium jinanense]|uniref:Cytochrome c domain-containing protein n=1 Tax=Polyangium jinanense TaxID=2829994 RepID=A0A9X3X0Q9_9BACT|nr:hypothetical protein [Polyangium jinanense]MDC3952475.1 hypothetical protein [Polyangium jinanense]MDC3980103.1 hypothetical protein [Polyangium jinanense]